jgi:predicted dehydrogenase
MDTPSDLWLIGAGLMAQAYVDVLQAQNIAFRVIGRGVASAETLRLSSGVPVFLGLDKALAELPAPSHAIVAVGIEQLATVAQKLIESGCYHILLEKPGALHHGELKSLQVTAEAHSAQIWIAYNRRFYASVEELRKRVIDDGGITSATLEFTEWGHEIVKLEKASGVKDRWLLANSSHVLDLAFHLIGLPAEGQWQAWHSGALEWHPAAARFHGAGVSELGIPFSYQADWEAPGRWGLEILTQHHRYILRPMEDLQVINLGSVNIISVALNNSLDHLFKPGIYLQCKAFLSGETEHLCRLNDHIRAFEFYTTIAGYTP